MAQPFTWGKLESMHGPLGSAQRRRIEKVIKDPTATTWATAGPPASGPTSTTARTWAAAAGR